MRQPYHHGFMACCLTVLLLSACSRGDQQTAQGYIEGRYTYITTSVSGQLIKLAVARGEQVRRGQALFSLEAQPESDQRQAASDALERAKAEHDVFAARSLYAELTYQRYRVLVTKKAIEQSQLDEAKANSNALLAQLVESNAKIAEQQALLNKADWTTQQKKITAPIDGFVFDIYYRLGEYTLADKPVLALLAPQDVKAVFYIPEAYLRGIKLGDAVMVSCDRCETDVKGKVSYVSPTAEYTPPVIYSNETNSKQIYRIEAEFLSEDAKRLHPGQPVSVKYQSMADA